MKRVARFFGWCAGLVEQLKHGLSVRVRGVPYGLGELGVGQRPGQNHAPDAKRGERQRGLALLAFGALKRTLKQANHGFQQTLIRGLDLRVAAPDIGGQRNHRALAVAVAQVLA